MTSVIRTLTRKLFSRRYLILTNTAVYGSLMGFGDIIVQKHEHFTISNGKQTEHDWNRTARLALMGCSMGPVNHFWYKLLDQVLIGRTLKIVAKKILLDQIIASPVFATLFFMETGLLEGKKVSACLFEFKQKFWTVYKADWLVWPAAQLINFFFLPSSMRVTYVAFVTLGWNTFLSYIKHKDVEKNVKILSG